MKKRCIIITVSASALLTAGGVILANRFIGSAVPEFSYSEPADASSLPLSETISADDIGDADDSVSETAETIRTDETANSDKVKLCGDPQHSVNVGYDGYVLTVSGTCPENMEISASTRSDTVLLPAGCRNGNDYTITFDIGNMDSGSIISLEMFFGSGSGMVYDYKFFTDGTGITEGDFSAVSEINAASLENASELTAAYSAEYVLPNGTEEERAEVLSQILELSDRICAGLDSDYDKARALAEWVSANIYYDFDARHDSVDMETVSLSHVLETHRTVCIGYANLYAALCSAQGITCYNASGDALQGELDYEKRLEHTALHEWNIVVIDGQKINVDTVWDTTNAYSGGQYSRGEVYGKFFDAGDLLFSQGHRARKTEIRDYFR